MSVPALYIKVAERAPQVGGLLAVADVVDESDTHVGLGTQFMQDQCGMPAFAPGLCDPALDPGGSKSFAGITPLIASPFALYSGVECYLGEREEFYPRAESTLKSGETFGVEQALLKLVFQSATLPTVISGTFDMVHGIGALEQALAANYPGLGTIHMTRDAATVAIAARAAFPDLDYKLCTGQGTWIANGAGYTGNGPNNVAPASGKEWIYGTGAVHVVRGPIQRVDAVNPVYNLAEALAERIYTVSVECVTYALQVTI